MRAFYERVRARRGSQIAIVAVARKLAVLFWHLLRNRRSRTTSRRGAPQSLPRRRLTPSQRLPTLPVNRHMPPQLGHALAELHALDRELGIDPLEPSYAPSSVRVRSAASRRARCSSRQSISDADNGSRSVGGAGRGGEPSRQTRPRPQLRSVACGDSASAGPQTPLS